MTNSRLAAMDKRFRERALATGGADAAQFRLTTRDDPVDCIVLVDRGMLDVGNDARTANAQVAITVFRDQVPEVRLNKSMVTIAESGEVFTLVAIDSRSDESRGIYAVKPGAPA
jgi:hypothetical protein